MSASSQDPSNQLAYALPCGFCAARPSIVWLEDGDFFQIGCESVDCNAQPLTEPRAGGGEDDRAFDAALAAAVLDWNRSARFKLRLPWPATRP